MIIMAPSDENETRQMLYTGYQYIGPAAVRYPRGKGPGNKIDEKMQSLAIGKALIKRSGGTVAILAFGSMLSSALETGEALNATVVDMRFIKPLDELLIAELAQSHSLIVTLEENTVMGGAGSAVNEFLLREDHAVAVLNLGLPDSFLNHGKVSDMLATVGLDTPSIIDNIKSKLAKQQ